MAVHLMDQPPIQLSSLLVKTHGPEQLPSGVYTELRCASPVYFPHLWCTPQRGGMAELVQNTPGMATVREHHTSTPFQQSSLK